ncbi:hypothetical protein LshimejAT787_0103890 [Lyophyllum shimeji]|uniref:Uncharacterized protein n=1 Tax=Lyophyllum shimeji TaxID=47721 RepID=A0A9P3UJM3_LYOSH|nr:hypothetical protein LshimejAT787_0103890 [Lyophyllum shimeji]
MKPKHVKSCRNPTLSHHLWPNLSKLRLKSLTSFKWQLTSWTEKIANCESASLLIERNQTRFCHLWFQNGPVHRVVAAYSSDILIRLVSCPCGVPRYIFRL